MRKTSSTRGRTLLSLSLALLVGAAASLGLPRPALAEPVGQPVPAFEAADDAGATHSLAEFKGKTLVLVFWGSGCPTTTGYAQRLQAIAQLCQQKSAGLLGVASNKADDAATVARAKGAQGLAFPILIDRGGTIARQLGARMTPTACVIDGEGVLRYFGAIDDDPPGTNPGVTSYLRQAIEAVTAGRAPATAETRVRGCVISP